MFTLRLQFYDTLVILLEGCGFSRTIGCIDELEGEKQMSLTAAALALLAGQSALSLTVELPRAESQDVAYAELVAGQDQAALAKLLAAREVCGEDPALLINLGAAYTRLGRVHEARKAYDAAIVSDERYDLETGSGKWIDSRYIARTAKREGLDAQRTLAML